MKCALTFWPIALLHNRSHAFTVPVNDASLQHCGQLSCNASLVLLAPTQLLQVAVACPSSLITVASAVCTTNKVFQL